MKAVVASGLLYVAIGIAHAIYMARHERRHLEAMKRTQFPGMSVYELCLIALVWPLLTMAAIVEWLERKKK